MSNVLSDVSKVGLGERVKGDLFGDVFSDYELGLFVSLNLTLNFGQTYFSFVQLAVSEEVKGQPSNGLQKGPLLFKLLGN